MHRTTLTRAATSTLLALAAPAALAAIVEGTLQFEAWGFRAVNADGTASSAAAPVSPVTGYVRYRFDNSAGFMHQADGALVNGVPIEVSAWDFDIPWSGVLAVSYLKEPPNLGNRYDTLAFSQAPTTTVDFGQDDWRLMVSAISTTPTFLQLWYSPQGEQIAYGAVGPANGSVRAVPEPATAALLLAALGMLATTVGARRRHG